MNKPIHRILFATDFSPGSLEAFRCSLAWVEACQADLDIVHVMGMLQRVGIDESLLPGSYIAEQQKYSRSRLEQLILQAKEQVPSVQTHLLEGIPAEQIAEFALDSHADLLITGTHGWTGIDRIVMGSVAERVVCQAPCPVLTVRSKDEGESESAKFLTGSKIGGPHHLLVPIDFSDCSLDAFGYASQIAKWFDASVTLLHAIEPLSYSLDFNLTHPIEDQRLRQKVESRLSDLAGALKQEGLSADYQLGDKPAVDTIVNKTADLQADLVVMGTHGRRGLSRLIMGSVTASALRRSSCPVLTVKSPKFTYGVSASESVSEEHAR